MVRQRDHQGRLLSAGAALAFHLGLGWWLLRPMPPPPAPEQEPGLLVTWIEPAARNQPLSVPPSTVSVPVPPHPRRGEAQAQPSTEPTVRYTADSEAGPQHEPGLPPVAALLEQGLQWAREQEEPPGFIADPLRGAHPGPRAPERFTTRTRVTPAAVVRAIGTLVGGADYESDPCPRIRRNLAALGPAGDSELIREEIRRLQSLCM